MATGIYRDGEQAMVRYEEKYDVPVDRLLYDAHGHLPLFETLPTAVEYQAAVQGVLILE